jgi:hypothetical protein
MGATARFTWTHYKGKPAVYDLDACVYYTGFPSMQAARARAEALNLGE